MPAEHSRFYNPEEDEAIQGRVAGYIEGWNERDPEKISNFFVSDADFVTVTGMKSRGIEAIRSLSESMLKTLPGSFHIRHRSISTRFIRNSVAVVDLSWELLQPEKVNHEEKIDPKALPYREGLATLVMSRARKQKPWLIEVIHHTGLISTELPSHEKPFPD